MNDNLAPLVDAELDEFREKRMKELKIENIIKIQDQINKKLK